MGLRIDPAGFGSGAPDDLDPLDLVGRRSTSGAFFRKLHADLGAPPWLLAGTDLAGKEEIPDRITVRDYLTIMGNLAEYGPDPTFHLEFIKVGVPLFYGGLDLGLRYAPDLAATLDMLVRYASDRPGYLRYRLSSQNEVTSLELVPQTDLRASRRIVLESPLLVYARLPNQYMGHAVDKVVIELCHSEPPYADRLRSLAGCEVRFDATRNAVNFPDAICRAPNIGHDAGMWRTALLRCAEESRLRAGQNTISRLRVICGTALAEKGRVPRLRDAARLLGVSDRTLIRRLRDEGLRYQDLTDDLLRRQSRALLTDPDLTIAQVSERLGFADASSFHRGFRRWFGTTPDQYRRGDQPGG